MAYRLVKSRKPAELRALAKERRCGSAFFFGRDWTCSTTLLVAEQVSQFLALWAAKLHFQVEVIRNLKVIEQLS